MSFITYEIKKVSGAKGHGENYIKVKPPLIRHLLRKRLLKSVQTKNVHFPNSLKHTEEKRRKLKKFVRYL